MHNHLVPYCLRFEEQSETLRLESQVLWRRAEDSRPPPTLRSVLWAHMYEYGLTYEVRRSVDNL